MTIKSRLKKLETASPSSVPSKILFVAIVKAKDGREDGPPDYHHAIVAGTTLGRIMRNPDETNEAFARRVKAIKAGGKHIEDMTEDERMAAFAAVDLEMEGGNHDDK